MKTTYYLLMLIILINISCDKTDSEIIAGKFSDERLTGSWADTIVALPKGSYIYELEIDSNATFKMKTTALGIYPTDETKDTSSWWQNTGNLIQHKDSLYFNATTYKWWDSFYQMEVKTEIVNIWMYQFCTYTISSDLLTLKYITYPADAPVETFKTFTCSE